MFALMIGHLVFQRIYFHMLDGSLDSQSELKDHLAVYLQGLDDYENVYSPYPDALLFMRYICSIGSIISETAEGFIQGVKSVTFKTNEERADSETANETQNDETLESSREENRLPELKVESELESNSKNGVPALGSIQLKSDSSRVIPITFWHAVDVYTCLTRRMKNDASFEKALAIMAESATTLKKDNWLMASNCLHVLGECSKLSIKVLNLFLSIGLGKNKLSASDDLVERSLFSYQDEDFMTTRSGYHRNQFGLESWPWELCCVYVDTLVDVCIKTSQTQIRRKALMGFNKDATEAMKKNITSNSKPSWCGLLDMAKFQLIVENLAVEGKSRTYLAGKFLWVLILIHLEPLDISWKVRYFALKGLIQICKHFKNDPENEDFRRTCWTSLVVCYESELDPRVLEAFKVGQVSTRRLGQDLRDSS